MMRNFSAQLALQQIKIDIYGAQNEAYRMMEG